MAVKQILRDFSLWTSAHGIPHIGSAQNICLRVFWAVVFVGSTCAFVSQMVLLVQKYLQYEVTVQTELKFEERSFPAVTICNLNPYKKLASAGTPLADLMTEYVQALNKSAVNGQYGLTGDAVAVQARTSDALLYLAAQLSNDTRDALMYSKDELIKNCAYNTRPCNIEKDFVQLVDPVYGACYIFNFPEPASYNSTRAGPLYGLRLLVQSNQSEYLESTESAGARVTIGSQNETPFPDAFGYNAATGYTTSFGVKFIKTVRKGPPYGNCTDNPDTDYFYNGPYSTEACFRSCFQKQLVSACGCADPRYNPPRDMRWVQYCNISQMDCINRYSEASGTDPVQRCACPQPCTESSYGVTVSTALWPSQVYTPPECKEENGPWAGNKTQCQQWYGENTMLIEVYYERMNYQELTESEAYALVNLISDMGGQLGLWMGFSVITVIEFFALLILVLLYACNKPKSTGSAGSVGPVRQPVHSEGDWKVTPPPYQMRHRNVSTIPTK